jgi:hypothetical protein
MTVDFIQSGAIDSDFTSVSPIVAKCSAAINLAVSLLAQARCKQQDATLGSDSSSTKPAGHSDRPMRLLGSVLNLAMSRGILNITLSANMRMAYVCFEEGKEQKALDILRLYLQELVAMGRGRCVGCGQPRNKSTPMLTCSACGVAR